MKDLQWFPPIPEPRAAFVPQVTLGLIMAAAMGGLLLARGHVAMAVVVWAVALALALGLLVPVLRVQILRAARGLGQVAGRISTLIFLWPFYFVVLGAIRAGLWLARVDLLDMRLDPDQPSYWQAAAPERKRARHYEQLFTVERARAKSHFLAWVIGFAAFAIILAGSSELVLRSMGFGDPVLYRVDPRIGYYPAPNQNVHRYGGDIHINAFGMRSRDVALNKPAGTYRILMLGDSTLYAGSYIDQGGMYATLLEKWLNENARLLPHSPQRVEVLCIGVNGWGPQHELAYVRAFGIFHADLVMVMGPPTDAYRARTGIAQMPFFVEGHRPHWAWREFWEHLLWDWNLRLTGAHGDYLSDPQAAKVLSDGIAAWMDIATLAQAQGARVDFELLPHEEEARNGKADGLTQRVLDGLLPELAKKRIPESYPLNFIGKNLGVLNFYHDGVHLDTAGHKLYALYLRDRVLDVANGQ